jgi:hypothetical protein
MFEHLMSQVDQGLPTWQRIERSMMDMMAQTPEVARMPQTTRECRRIWVRRR